LCARARARVRARGRVRGRVRASLSARAVCQPGTSRRVSELATLGAPPNNVTATLTVRCLGTGYQTGGACVLRCAVPANYARVMLQDVAHNTGYAAAPTTFVRSAATHTRAHGCMHVCMCMRMRAVRAARVCGGLGTCRDCLLPPACSTVLTVPRAAHTAPHTPPADPLRHDPHCRPAHQRRLHTGGCGVVLLADAGPP
jgi:hypothetical protein